jgi:dihydroorotate dehydrogenase (fumarate)
MATPQLPPKLIISPPLLNSANPWATSLADLQTLFDCPYTGAITTRTALLHGFPHDDRIHQYTFFDPLTHETAPAHAVSDSPIPLASYLEFVATIAHGAGQEDASAAADTGAPAGSSATRRGEDGAALKTGKAIILSVTGSAADVAAAYRAIHAAAATCALPLAVEINLSCPNIPDRPPPAYSAAALGAYLQAVAAAVPADAPLSVPLGVKTPPFTYADQFAALMRGLQAGATPRFPRGPVSFVTATNTLGGCLLLAPEGSEGAGEAAALRPVLRSASGAGIGGMAGAPLHPLALGNVVELRRRLDAAGLGFVDVIGVGGVEDREGFERMRSAGAAAVGVGTGLGRRGVGVFAEIWNGGMDDEMED